MSQYLPAGPLESDRVEFDAVIFDEASQVLPEDALPAIERGRQVIVVGDRLQLPPTTFFQRSLGDDVDHDDDEDEASDSFEGRESILDVMVGQVGKSIEERYLSVHYRSRSEGLIRFSNHAFYEDRLLTFPDPDTSVVAVQDVFLPQATYDAGGSRTNREEAERVADIVFDLMESRPLEESIGVVALSRSQANLIETLIEERRLINRHLDDRFSGDLDERFFVKNLENVQGDERDHMVLSVGYGPTTTGAVPNRFGPINQGRRRTPVERGCHEGAPVDDRGSFAARRGHHDQGLRELGNCVAISSTCETQTRLLKQPFPVSVSPRVLSRRPYSRPCASAVIELRHRWVSRVIASTSGSSPRTENGSI